MRRILFLFLACTAWTSGEIINPGPQPIPVQQDQDQPFYQAQHHDITQVIVSNITIVNPLQRHEEEFARLQARLDRGSRAWDASHPRHRLLSALWAFSRYKERHQAEITRWRDLYKGVSKKQRSIIESTIKYTRKLNTAEHLLDDNDNLAKDIVRKGLQFYHISTAELASFIAEQDKLKKTPDKTSATQAMKHFVRDWAEEGAVERDEAFPCLMDELKRMRRADQRLQVLVPGGGAGRLAHEIARLDGFEVTMNEWSMYMNLIYRYMTTAQPTPHSISFHPYIDWWSHHATTADLQRAVAFPDEAVDPSQVVLVEGDFTSVFNGQDGTYDVIVTLFFLDTARNLLSYLETIHRLLQPGGVWLNLGPLLYGSAPLLQLSLDEIIALAETVGFRFEEIGRQCGEVSLGNVRGKDVAYGRNARGLSKNAYIAQTWRAVKVS